MSFWFIGKSNNYFSLLLIKTYQEKWRSDYCVFYHIDSSLFQFSVDNINIETQRQPIKFTTKYSILSRVCEPV